MLADDAAVEQVSFGDHCLLSALAPGAIHLSCSTVSVELVQRLAQAHREHQQVLVSAPVFGRPEAAEAATLFVVAAGESKHIEKCRPVFDAIGQRTFVVGERPEQANVIKLCGNFMIAAAIEVLAEAMTMARKNDIDSYRFLDVMTETLFPAPIYRNYGKLVAQQGDVPVGFRLALGLKDVKLVLAAAEAAAVPMPVASVIRDHLLAGVARGLGDADWSALSRIVAENAGVLVTQTLPGQHAIDADELVAASKRERKPAR
jgi:3-hydroxyisobutyrate dehydrogenase-like beta-hydroxyacid dehydrogenase